MFSDSGETLRPDPARSGIQDVQDTSCARKNSRVERCTRRKHLVKFGRCVESVSSRAAGKRFRNEGSGKNSRKGLNTNSSS